MDKPTDRLSKSQFTRGLQCPKSLWLYHHGREHQSAPDSMAQSIFDQGTAAGELAQKAFPGGVLIDVDHRHPLVAVAETEQAVEDGAKVIYEAAAIFENTIIRADILRLNAGGTWDVIEVKSSTSVKDTHIDDMAVQTWVLEGAGYQMQRSWLMHINKNYVLDGDVDVNKLFTIGDHTDHVKERMVTVPALIKNFHAIVAQKETPDIGIGERCGKPYECDFKAYCWAAVPEDSVWSIGGIRKNKASKLWDAGRKTIAAIPKSVEFNGKQARQVEAIRTGKTLIDIKAIAAHIGKLEWPLHFLDFETVGEAVPRYNGMRPFENLTFQASIHFQDMPGGGLKHSELLVDPDSDPRRPMVDFILKNIEKEGTVIAYNTPFERGCIFNLGEKFDDAKKHMDSIIDRLWDVAEPFKKGHYMHPDFHGSWSLKAVLPAVVPGMTYADLEVAQGGDASALWLKAMRGEITGEKLEKLKAALLAYCGQDTLGTVKILEFLIFLIELTPTKKRAPA